VRVGIIIVFEMRGFHFFTLEKKEFKTFWEAFGKK
jgi:hypothetical protein